MAAIELEHVNFTVGNPDATAQRLCELFGWKIRWKGDAMMGGKTVHVGTDNTYLALYSPGDPNPSDPDRYRTIGGLNHVAVLVDDLEAVEARVRQAGFTPHSHADYEPGRRFYFDDGDAIEYEVVSYTKT
jgi:catechol 2,3-dioxygenase-like lactoylglutathione lyase family enzyme